MKHNIATPLLLTLALSACGGGGDSDNNNNNGGNNDDNTGGTFTGVPYDYARYQDALDNANLQVSDNPDSAGSSKSDVVDAGEYDSYESEHFYIDTTSGNLTFEMSNDKNRAELRFSENFLSNEVDKQYILSAELLPINPQASVANSSDGQEITLLQVHNKGTSAKTDDSVLSHPLLRVVWDGENRTDDVTGASYNDAYWAIIKTNAYECSNEDGDNYNNNCPDSYDYRYLGGFSEGEFTRFDIIIAESELIINVNDTEKVAHDIYYWSELYSYFKAGVYNQYEDGNSVVEFKSITFSDSMSSLPMADLDASVAPSENFELIDWYLSVPSDDDNNGKADSIKEKDLIKDYEDEYFYTAADGGMVFKTYIGGAKTSTGTDYTRTELREMLRRNDTSIDTSYDIDEDINGNGRLNNWAFSSIADNDKDEFGGIDGTLTATLAVNHVTTSGDEDHVGRVIVGQIHAKDNEPARLYYRLLPGHNKGSIYLAHEPADGFGDEQWYELIGSRSDNAAEPVDGIALDEKFSYTIEVVGNMLIVTIKREGYADVVQDVNMINSGYDNSDNYMYYKAGVYNQNKSGDDNDYVQATFYYLTNTHTGYNQ